MNCIIVDDEPKGREGIELNLKEMGYLQLLRMFPNALQAKEFMDHNPVDLIFLDIEMPGLNGLEFIRSLKDKPLIILSTAYPQHALEAFELDVVDYLVKPIRFERFYKAVNKAKEIFELRKNTPYAFDKTENDYAYIRSERKIIKLFFDEILYIKGLKDYVIIYTVEGKYITALNIKTIHNQLPKHLFARVSKSYLINVEHIKSIESDSIDVAGHEIPLGMSYKDDFLNKYIKKSILDRKK